MSIGAEGRLKVLSSWKERRDVEKLQPRDFSSPAIPLGGPVDYEMYKNFRL
jgi:hypothetical protein